MRNPYKRFAEENRIRATVVMSGEPNPFWEIEHNAWKVTLKRNGRQMTIPFYTGMGITEEPGAGDVLECLAADASGYLNASTMREWAHDLGYEDEAWLRAEHDYQAVSRMTYKLQRFLGDDLFRALLDTEYDESSE